MPVNICVGNTHMLSNIPPGLIKGHHSEVCSKGGKHRFILFAYLEGEKREITDRVIKTVEYRLLDECKHHKVTIEKQPFIFSRLANHSFPVEIIITFKKWAKLPEMRRLHTLNFEDNGDSGTKEFEIGLPKETYLENMMKVIQ